MFPFSDAHVLCGKEWKPFHTYQFLQNRLTLGTLHVNPCHFYLLWGGGVDGSSWSDFNSRGFYLLSCFPFTFSFVWSVYFNSIFELCCCNIFRVCFFDLRFSNSPYHLHYPKSKCLTVFFTHTLTYNKTRGKNRIER